MWRHTCTLTGLWNRLKKAIKGSDIILKIKERSKLYCKNTLNEIKMFSIILHVCRDKTKMPILYINCDVTKISGLEGIVFEIIFKQILIPWYFVWISEKIQGPFFLKFVLHCHISYWKRLTFFISFLQSLSKDINLQLNFKSNYLSIHIFLNYEINNKSIT